MPYDPFAADMWSLGVTIFQVITGDLPFEGKNVKEYLTNVMSEEVEIPELPEWAPKLWRDVVGKLLVRDPKKRLTIW